MSNIGIMDPAFFVGKNVLLKWLNDFFEIGYTKVEQTASGAIHCQILDAIFPGKVPLHKVNFDAKFDYEFVQNYKVLQSVFDKEQITKHIDVAKLIKAKYQDNLEMLQWMKNFFDKHYNGAEYNAKERREQAKAQYKKAHKHAGSSSKTEATSSSSSAAAVADSPAKPVVKKTVAAAPAAAPAAVKRTTAPAPLKKAAASSGNDAAVNALTNELGQLKLTVEGLEKERNFYFGKLREIEILCQAESETQAAELADFKQQVLNILYQTDENSEFQVPQEEEAAAPEQAEAEQGLLDNNEIQE